MTFQYDETEFLRNKILQLEDEKIKSSEAEENSALNIQVSGDHYKSMKIQPVEFINLNDIPFIEGSIIKYVCRHKNKNGKIDLEKAKHFIEMLIELEY